MRGSNQLVVNEATVRVALQEYINLRWSKEAPEEAPEVVAVEWDAKAGMFVVFVESEPAPSLVKK